VVSLTAWAVLPRVRLDDTEDPEDVFDETARLPGIAERNSEVELDELDVSLFLEQPVINKAKQRVLINTKHTVRIVPPNLKMNIIFVSNV
jgi:hypothetical protein